MTVIDELRGLLRRPILKMIALAALLAGVGARAFQLKYCITETDLWWHLKTGDWILRHGALPHTGILSRTAANRPWVAYSWGYEVLLSWSYSLFGLVGLGLFGTLLTVGICFGIYWMLWRLSGRFWLSCLGTGIICWAFLFTGSPRPYFFSMMLYAVILALLLEAHRSGNIRILYWLPPIFIVWANLHIQFIYGLFPVGLLMAICLLQDWTGKLGITPELLCPNRLPGPKVALIFLACLIGTLIGPNFYLPYLAVLHYSEAKFSYSVIIELFPLSFRDIRNYIELFLAAAGFFAIGWRRKIDLFKLLLQATACVLAFRTMRDAWFLCITSGALIFDLPVFAENREKPWPWPRKVGVAAAFAILLLVSSTFTRFNQRELDRAVSANYPVDAVNFLRRHPVPGPLYNNLAWGGFLMWYMPQYPVAIDGRNDLYGDKLDRIFYECASAGQSYPTDPYLNEAGVVILPVDLPLAKVLVVDPRFRLIYRDQIAVVYERN